MKLRKGNVSVCSERAPSPRNMFKLVHYELSAPSASGQLIFDWNAFLLVIFYRNFVLTHTFVKCGTTHAWPSLTDLNISTLVTILQSHSSGCQICTSQRPLLLRLLNRFSEMHLWRSNQLEISGSASGEQLPDSKNNWTFRLFLVADLKGSSKIDHK